MNEQGVADKKVLLVLSAQDAPLRDELTERLEAIPGVTVDAARNRQKAIERLRDGGVEYQMLVIGAALAHDAEAAISEDGGLRCCRAARLHTAAPMLLLVPKLTNDINLRCAEIEEPAPVPIEISDACAGHVAQQVKQYRPPARRLDIRIFAEATGWRYEMSGTGFAFERKGPLRVEDSAVLNWCYEREDDANWYLDFKRIGTSIQTCFCKENPDFEEHRKAGTKLAGGHGHTRVSFIVEPRHYGLLLESIFNPPEEPLGPWMIHAPLVRNVKVDRGGESELFTRPLKRLRSLLICAETDGIVPSIRDDNGKPLVLRELEMARKECEKIEHFLKLVGRRQERIAVDDPVILRNDENGPVTEERLLDVLRNAKPFDLIHFAGHSYFQPSARGKGAYLFVGAPGEPQPVDFHTLAPHFRSAGFLFLSSCYSSNAAFIEAATQSGIYAIAGYRQKVPDAGAYRQARMFYQELLRNRSIDTAFCRARQRLHKVDPRSYTWASAMLVQTHH